MAGNVYITEASSSGASVTPIAVDDLIGGTRAQFVKLLTGSATSSGIIGGSTGYGLETDLKREPTYGTLACGELAGSVTATSGPTVSCRMARLVALASNAGNVYVGFSSGVTKADGTTDTVTGLEMAPGFDTGWIPVANINVFYRISDNAGDDLTYWAIG